MSEEREFKEEKFDLEDFFVESEKNRKITSVNLNLSTIDMLELLQKMGVINSKSEGIRFFTFYGIIETLKAFKTLSLIDVKNKQQVKEAKKIVDKIDDEKSKEYASYFKKGKKIVKKVIETLEKLEPPEFE